MRFLCKIGIHCSHSSTTRPDEWIPRYHGKFVTGHTERTHYECCLCGYAWYEDRKWFYIGGR